MRWLLLFLAPCIVHWLVAAEGAIAFIHLGPTLPPHASVAIRQARLFNPDWPIYLVANTAALAGFSEEKVETVAAESLARSGFHEQFVREAKESGFWRYVVERFFYLEELMRQYGLKNVFHLENDVMLYASLDRLLPICQRHYRKMIGATFDCDRRCIAGLIYISEVEPLSEFLHFATSPSVQRDNDMFLLAKFRKGHYKKWIDHLPIVMPSYTEAYPLESTSGEKGQNKGDYSNHYDEFLSLFDAAAMGQYLGGIDPIHPNHEPGFINETSVVNPSYFKFVWEKDRLGRQIPWLQFQNERCPLNNLHIHSKNLAPFFSLNEGPMPTMEPPSPPEKIPFPLSPEPIDVILYATEKEGATLDLSIDSIKTHLAPIGRIIVISPTPLTQKGEWFDSHLFPFSKEVLLTELFPSDLYARRRAAAQPRNQLDSILAHLTKLYAPRVIPNLSSNVLIVDPHVVFLEPIELMDEGGRPLFHARGKQVANHLNLGKKLLPSYFLGEYSEVAHFVLMQRAILEDLFAHFSEEPWKAICRKIDKEKLYETPFSALSLYGQFALQRVAGAKLQPLHWEAVATLYQVGERKGVAYLCLQPPGPKN